jgi:NAD-dependent SIR2 family protein deacetylase
MRKVSEQDQENVNIVKAKAYLEDADGLLIGAGAGMGVDSGLPDFRGNEGFWKAYPPLAAAGIKFTDIANPAAFKSDPARAWGFYGHRLALYRKTVPHPGFEILRRMAARMSNGSFVFTSNVDGQFQKAGFAESHIIEYHGTIHQMQCTRDCASAIWSADDFMPEVNMDRCQLTSDVPVCPHCGATARPNILMFNDSDWNSKRADAQDERLQSWLNSVKKLVVIELGAGTAIPSVRRMGENLNVPMIRINPREWKTHRGHHIGIASGALAGLSLLLK